MNSSNGRHVTLLHDKVTFHEISQEPVRAFLFMHMKGVWGHIVVALSIYLSFQLYVLLSLVSVCSRHVQTISPILFEVGIPNLMCGCILGWRSVTYHLGH